MTSCIPARHRWAAPLALALVALGQPQMVWAQNVGIGTTQPTQTLDVNGSTRVRGLSGTGVRVVTADDNGNLSTAPLGTGGTTGSYIQNQTTVQPGASFNIGNNGVIGGRLGIGTDAPATALDLYNGEFRLTQNGGAPAPAQLSQLTSNVTTTATGVGPGQTFSLPLGARITQIDVFVAPGATTSGTFRLQQGTPSAGAPAIYSQTVNYTAGPITTATSIVLPTPTDPLMNQQYSFSLGSNVLAHYASGGNPYAGGQAFANTTALNSVSDLKFVVYYIDPGTAALYANPVGQVGIGTLFPTANLDVVGTARFSSLGSSGTRAVFADNFGQLSAQPVPGSQNEFWNTTGNVGLPNGRFLGTTDNVEVPFRVNNTEVMRLKANGAIWAGLRTNVMLGVNAGAALDVGATANTFVGQGAGAQAVATPDNTLIGNLAGTDAVGSRNTALGSQAGAALGTGTDNTLLGASAGRSATGALHNVAVGTQAGVNLGAGVNNVWVGYQSGLGSGSSTGDGNVGVGTFSGRGISSGTGNTFVGQSAGATVETGSNNVLLGAGADVVASTYANLQNAGAIGHNAKVGRSNALVLGGTNLDAVSIGINNPYPFSRVSLGDNGFPAYSTPETRLALREGVNGENFVGIGMVKGTVGVSVDGGLGLWGGSGGSTPPYDGSTGQKAALTVYSSTTPRVGVGTYDPISLLSNTDNAQLLLPSDNVLPGSSALAWLTEQNNSYAAVLANNGTGNGANGLAVKVDGTRGASTTALLVSKAPSGGSTAPLLVVKASGNVGVGVAAPQAALDVNGNAQFSGTVQATGSVQTGGNYNYSTLQTRAVAVGASAFQPTAAASWQLNAFGPSAVLSGAIANGTAGTTRSVYADVYLPDGATVNGLSALVYDADATNSVQVFLETISLADGTFATAVPPLIATDQSAGSAASYQTLNLASGAPVITTNTAQYRYRLRFDTRDNNANLRLAHVKVTYTVVKAD
ncbi:beta strand repeat-containing protein [Hymenobacter ruber]